jgi:hypothetical protein
MVHSEHCEAHGTWHMAHGHMANDTWHMAQLPAAAASTLGGGAGARGRCWQLAAQVPQGPGRGEGGGADTDADIGGSDIDTDSP